MLIKKPRLFAAAALFTVLSLSLVALLHILNNAVPRLSVAAPYGTADLAGFDFSSSVAHVSGAEFYINRVLSPQQLAVAAPDGHSYGETARYHTARVRFLVPEGDYVIFGLSPQYASRIYINGSLAGVFGRFDEENAENNIYRVALFSSPARPVGGEIELVAQIAGIIHDISSYNGFYIGSFETAGSAMMYDMAYRLIPVAIAFTCMLFFFGYFIFIPSVKPNLWFALLSLLTGFFLSGNGGVVTSLIPGEGITHIFEFYSSNITLLMMCACYSLFIRSFCGIPKAVPAVVCAVSAALIAMLFFPAGIARQYSAALVVFVFSVNITCIACMLLRIKLLKTEHAISFFGQAAFIISGVLDLLGASGVIGYYDATPTGLLLFIFAQMLALYIVNNRAVENERRLEAENASLESISRMKTELLGNISHEFKTPLTIISNVSQLAARYTRDEYVRDKMETAVTEVQRLKARAGRLMELAKIEDEQKQWNFQPVNILGMINETVVTYFQALDEHNNALSIELPDDLPLVKADAAHLPGVIVNLIENAVRFTRDGRISVRASHDGAFVAVSVEDTGCGMPPDQAQLIFQRFYTGEKSTGTGIGLHICKKVVEAHSGSVNVQSAQGAGTTVSFTLPVYMEDAP